MPEIITDMFASYHEGELADTLIAISVVAKHLANRIRERAEEESDVENE